MRLSIPATLLKDLFDSQPIYVKIDGHSGLLTGTLDVASMGEDHASMKLRLTVPSPQQGIIVAPNHLVFAVTQDMFDKFSCGREDRAFVADLSGMQLTPE